MAMAKAMMVPITMPAIAPPLRVLELELLDEVVMGAAVGINVGILLGPLGAAVGGAVGDKQLLVHPEPPE
jgi:hypothetical protein